MLKKIVNRVFGLPWFVLVLMLFCTTATALEGVVIGVHDGDTITVLSADNVQTKIRLAQIDAPELSQDWGRASKKALSDLVYKKNVVVNPQTKDRYGRLVGKVYQGENDIGKLQVKAGMAWVYVKYNQDDSLIEEERNAKSNRRGLWSLDDAVAPWNWRKENK